MTDAERLAQAETLLNTPLWDELLARLEDDAIDACILTDDAATREKRAVEARSIRSLRQQLLSIIEEAKPKARAFQPV